MHIFYGKKGTKVQEILARIQNICYTRYLRKSLGLQRNDTKVLERLKGQGKPLFQANAFVGTHILERRRKTEEKVA